MTTVWWRELRWEDLPGLVRARVACLLRDFAACSAAGRATPTARVAADHAVRQHAGDEATLLLDGRRASATGAAWANGVLANALDFDDGHRLVKGHPGANVIPAALATAEATGATPAATLAAIAVGYEVAIRAGIALHARAGSYHASGAWGAVGAAAAAARVLRLEEEPARHALGLAEYHAPMAPVMRSVADPAMTKDACGWGAFAGTAAALLAAGGFTAVASEFLEASAAGPPPWHVMDIYVKAYPCCRWSQPAVAAALQLRERHGLDPDAIERVVVATFAAATALAGGIPASTEEAQYSLAWPVAAALAHGELGVAEILPEAFADPATVRLAQRVAAVVDPGLEAAFPAARSARVAVTIMGGATYRSGVTAAPGDPGDVAWPGIVASKFACYARDLPPVLVSLLDAASR